MSVDGESTADSLRLRAAAQLGFRSAVVPKSSAAEVRAAPLSVRGVATVSEALEALLP